RDSPGSVSSRQRKVVLVPSGNVTVAPWPTAAEYNVPFTTLMTAPATYWPSTMAAKETAYSPNPYIKFTVPSIGSITQETPDEEATLAPPSPRSAQSGAGNVRKCHGSSMADSCGIQRAFYNIDDRSGDVLAINHGRQGSCVLPQPVHKVHGAINRVNHPGNTGRGGYIGAFFPDDSIVWPVPTDTSHHELFSCGIDLSHGVYRGSLRLAVSTDITRGRNLGPFGRN